MTRDETKRLLRIASALYPNWKPDELDIAVDAWSAVLAEEEAQIMANALKEFARTDTKGFAPSPGQLIEIGREIEKKMYWERVSNALTAKAYGALPGASETEE